MAELLSLDDLLFTEEPHRYVYRGREYLSVTQVIREAGFGEDFSAVPADRMEFCQRRGRMVHLACRMLSEGELDWSTVDPRIEGYVRAYEKFLAECPGKVAAVEHRLVYPDMGLAGTPDLVKFIGGRRALIDLKTGATKSAKWQTAGYAKLWAAIYPSKPIYERYSLKLDKAGQYKLIPHEKTEDEVAFDMMLHFALAKQRLDLWRSTKTAA